MEVVRPNAALPRFATEFEGAPYGTLFSYKGQVLMKCSPASYLNNSSLVKEKFAEGFSLATNMETGEVFFMKGSKEAKRIEGAKLFV